MESITALRYVPVWGFKMYLPDDNEDLTGYNKELRNWLARNIGSGTWETEVKYPNNQYSRDYDDAYVLVTIDKGADEDAMAFRLAWE